MIVMQPNKTQVILQSNTILLQYSYTGNISQAIIVWKTEVTERDTLSLSLFNGNSSNS